MVLREFHHPTEKQIDSLLGIYTNNKTFVDEYLEPNLIALSYFSELKDTPITFKYSKEAKTMVARPIPITAFRKICYQIMINNQSDFKGVILSDVPFNAQIGVIAHELSHIIRFFRIDNTADVGWIPYKVDFWLTITKMPSFVILLKREKHCKTIVLQCFKPFESIV